MRSSETSAGKVFLIGAGPGDPKLLTIRAVEAISASDAIVYDYLVNPEILRHAKPQATLIFAGKRAGRHTLSQEHINDLLIERAALGQTVARLKCGDPFIFGRGGEEAEALTAAGIEWEVVPGISSGVAAAAYAGIPLTHRGHASSVAFLTGHSAAEKARGVDWRVAATGADTLVIFMCASTITTIARELVAGGRAGSTPVAIIRWATYEHQRVFRTTLENLAAMAEARSLIESPAIAVVGEVVGLSERLNWFGQPAVDLAEAIPGGELNHHSEEDAYVAVRCRA